MNIRLKIDVKKIDKARLYVGKKGTYLDATLIATPDGKYGDDYMIVQSVSREDREAGVNGAIIGNAKNIVAGQSQTAQGNAPSGTDDMGESFPF